MIKKLIFQKVLNKFIYYIRDKKQNLLKMAKTKFPPANSLI